MQLEQLSVPNIFFAFFTLKKGLNLLFKFYTSKVYVLLEQEETKLQQVRLQKQRGRKQPEQT